MAQRKPPYRKKLPLNQLPLIVLLAVIAIAAFFYFSGLDPFATLDQAEQLYHEVTDVLLPDAQRATPSPTSAGSAIMPAEKTPAPTTPQSTLSPSTAQELDRVKPREGQLSVLVLDIGQGDSILIRFPNGKTMLIDTGEYEYWDRLNNYLHELDVEKIDALVGTHPHSDHIGSMQSVVKNYDIGTIYMPRVEHTSKTYLNLLKAIEKKGLKIKGTKGGQDQFIELDDSVTVQVLAPLSDTYDSLNNYSIVLRITMGDVSILLTGDAERESEKEMLETYPASSLHSTVLKVGHHGSSSSTSASFLKVVDPTYALISLGANNDYGHPHDEVIKRLDKSNVQTLLTSEKGSLAFFTDGNTFEICTEKQ